MWFRDAGWVGGISDDAHQKGGGGGIAERQGGNFVPVRCSGGAVSPTGLWLD